MFHTHDAQRVISGTLTIMEKINCPECKQSMGKAAYLFRHKDSVACKRRQERNNKKPVREKSYCK